MDKLVTGQGLQQSLKTLIQQETKPPILIQDTPGFWLKIYLRMYLNNLMAHFIVLQVANFCCKGSKIKSNCSFSNLWIQPCSNFIVCFSSVYNGNTLIIQSMLRYTELYFIINTYDPIQNPGQTIKLVRPADQGKMWTWWSGWSGWPYLASTMICMHTDQWTITIQCIF